MDLHYKNKNKQIIERKKINNNQTKNKQKLKSYTNMMSCPPQNSQ